MRNPNQPAPAGLFNPQNIRDRTAALRVPPEPAPQPEDTRTDQQRRVQDALNLLDFGCQQDNVRQLVGAILDFDFEKKPVIFDEEDHPGLVPGCLYSTSDGVVLISYTDPDGDGYYIKPNGSTDGGAFVLHCGRYEPASEEQVEAFIAEMNG